MKFLVIFVTVLVSMGTANSLKYPVFGTKRYHRGVSPRTEMTQHILRQPVYENGYITSNGYYYYPHHEYHSYGMPTYRGEYKPKAYYYSSGPSYNYYNDREPVSNPLDDLHEEILQENEQERQTTDMLGDDDYEEEYYIDPNDSPRDSYTNNFLRNMIDYNRQKEKLQRLQELHQQQVDQPTENVDEEDGQPVDEDYFSEFDVNPDDYQFEPKGEANFDLQKYWDAEMSSLANSATANTGHHQRDRESMNAPHNDQDVEQLKSLTKSKVDSDEDGKRYHGKVKLGQYPQLNSWRHEEASEPIAPKPKEHEEDYSALDYDDGSWINWDRKRNSLPDKTKALKNSNKSATELKIRKRLLAASKKEQLNPENMLGTMSPASILKSFGQKEKYPTLAPLTKPKATAGTQTEKNHTSAKAQSKTTKGIEQSIYDTIKQMISIEQELKKTGSKKRKRFVTNEESLVNQLDSLRRIKN